MNLGNLAYSNLKRVDELFQSSLQSHHKAKATHYRFFPEGENPECTLLRKRYHAASAFYGLVCEVYRGL